MVETILETGILDVVGVFERMVNGGRYISEGFDGGFQRCACRVYFIDCCTAIVVDRLCGIDLLLQVGGTFVGTVVGGLSLADDRLQFGLQGSNAVATVDDLNALPVEPLACAGHGGG